MIEVGIVGISPHLSTDRMLAGCARLPDHPDPDPSPLAVLIKDHLLDEKAQDLFALGRRRGCGIPQLRQILAQGDNLRALGRAQRCRLLATPTLVFRFNLLDLAEPPLPGALKRTRHQPVLRLHGIVLPAGPLRLVMGPLAPERPLALQQVGLFLKLAPSGDGQGEPIRRQRRQRQALYRGVDRQGSDLLATRPAVLLPVGGTLIYGVVAARPGIAQTHAAAARAAAAPAAASRTGANTASPIGRCEARQTWQTATASEPALLRRGYEPPGRRGRR